MGQPWSQPFSKWPFFSHKWIISSGADKLELCNKRPVSYRGGQGPIGCWISFSTCPIFIPVHISYLFLAHSISLSDCCAQTALRVSHQSSFGWSHEPWPTPRGPTPFWKAVSLKPPFLVSESIFSGTHFLVPGFLLRAVAALFLQLWGFPPQFFPLAQIQCWLDLGTGLLPVPL